MEHCEMVKDLLPLVAENLASEESTAFVKEHLETCESCRAAFEEMKAPVEADPAAPIKSVRKSVKKRGLLIAGFIACLVAALLVAVIARLYKPIVLSSIDAAFADVSVIPETIPLPAPQAEKAQPSDEESVSSDAAETDMVKKAQQMIAIVVAEQDSDDGQSIEIRYVPMPDGETEPDDSLSFVFQVKKSDSTDFRTAAYVYTIPDKETANGQTIEPEAVIASTPKMLKLIPSKGTRLVYDRSVGELSIGAYTTLWDLWFAKEAELQETEIALSDLDAVFFEPYDNSDREILYVRDGYTPESGYALPRLVMNYYLAIALIGAAVLFVPWLVLLLTKKQKARRIVGVFLLIPTCFVLAFLAAGFPATTISPVRELMFVLIIALLLIGAGLCGRKLLRKE